jgi:hypothetical protein
MQIARTAPIMILIALSGCTEKPEASDPPAIGMTVDPGLEITADNAPMAEQAGDAEDPAEPRIEPNSERRMQSPVQYD